MTLNFPNPSRSYDNKHRCVRFWGYDGTFEISFKVDWQVFSRINPGTDDEFGILRSFDTYRDKILDVARRVYRGRHPGSYTLVAADF